MPTEPSQPAVSPDGRFEAFVDVWYERAAPEYTTVLVERASRREIASFSYAMDVHFDADGLLHLDRPGWSREAVQIDPARECLRAGAQQPWLPLTCKGALDDAYLRGWQNGLDYMSGRPESGFPWPDLWISLGAFAAIAVLLWQRQLPPLPLVVLLVCAALTAVVFAWVFLGNLKAWRFAQRQRRPLPPL